MKFELIGSVKTHSEGIKIARQVSGLSNDPKRKVGVILVGTDNNILSIGYNYGVNGFEDFVEKNKYMVHAEIAAVSNLRDRGKPDRCYITYFPCLSCAKTLVAFGVKELYFYEFPNGKWYTECSDAKDFLEACGVYIEMVLG